MCEYDYQYLKQTGVELYHTKYWWYLQGDQ